MLGYAAFVTVAQHNADNVQANKLKLGDMKG